MYFLPPIFISTAVILSAHPTWTYDQVYDALTMTAARIPLSNADRDCGLPTPDDYPNQACGHGRIDVAAALGL